jgi:acyl-CoA reductase-like NAD-dependent aldehyde dehydrogenase
VSAVSATGIGTDVFEVPMLIGGAERRGTTFDVIDPYRGTVASRVHEASPADVDAAVRSARQGAAEIAALPAHRRAAILRAVSEGVRAKRDELAERIVRDCGKCLRDARGEIDRAVEIYAVSADEATRIGGEVIPLDALPLGEGDRIAFTVRGPVGVVGAIGPFNAPVHVIAHKLGPAFAAGNAVVLKPAPQGSAVAAIVARIFYDAGLPVRALQLVPGRGATGEALAAHPGVDLVNFTGGGVAATAMLRTAGLKRTTLELGGNAAVIVHEDADWEKAAAACIPAAYGISGQSCVSLQRLYVHRSLFEQFAARFAELAGALRTGDTLSPETEVGAMVDERAATRVSEWIADAVKGGARLLCGGERTGNVIAPAVLVDVEPAMKVVCEEVFGPVVSIIPFDRIDDAIAAVNDSPWGLASGIYTRSLAVALAAVRRLRTGVLNVNAPSRFRVEHIPYGGLKLSGWGKEGPRYAVQEMTEVKTVIVSAP